MDFNIAYFCFQAYHGALQSIIVTCCVFSTGEKLFFSGIGVDVPLNETKFFCKLFALRLETTINDIIKKDLLNSLNMNVIFFFFRLGTPINQFV